MRDDSNNHYMAVLGALGALIENNKSDLALAQYQIRKLEDKLKAAEEELAGLKSQKPTVAKPKTVENSDYPFE